MPPGPVIIEACVDSVESALAAAEGGAHRLELCDNLVEGGTTPSAGMIAVVRECLSLPLHVLVRPRGGDFLYTAAELQVMLRDIAVARDLGADGVVIGALTADGEIDEAFTRRLVDAARPLAVTFHRAFDFTRDLGASLATLVRMGVERVLTSGGAASALDGMDALAELVCRSEERVIILAGGGVTEENARAIVERSGVREVHTRGAARVPSAMHFRRPGLLVGKPYEPADDSRLVTVAVRIARLAASLSAAVTSATSTAPADPRCTDSPLAPSSGTNDA